MALNNNTCFNLSLSMCSSIVTTQTDYSSSSSLNNNNVCVHLSMGVCPCSHASLSHCESCTSCSSSTKKRKQGQKDDTNGARKRARNDVERIRWGYSLDLMLYDDPWKIKKVLQKSDLGNMSRLLLPKDLAENLVLPVLNVDARRDAESERGTRVWIWDVDTNSMHSLLFKRWGSSKSYVFIDKWVQDFVKRRNLKEGDEVRFHWNPYNHHFAFTVLQVFKENCC
ncbi:PREDICTED: B3 domain-containing protein At2g33720-like isoform X1 [Lupinus angustifolius]|uniref:B3 domain-containing protein At2g33720-like isoform X1 n=1 Tax=Lupinus angustifolius TaxID=3871 RepID=UPI00092E8DB4|nr:PREDICTED: B3 domain-containing protein At2g33720-like isoform X1 [Lupinus angustifolius]